MMQVLYAVISISLAVLLTYGGTSYLNSEVPVRALASRGLYAQFESIQSGIASYRLENHGVSPTSVDAFAGYMPHGTIPTFGKPGEAFSWSVQPLTDAGVTTTAVCLHVASQARPILDTVALFAGELSRRSRIVPIYGDQCGQGTATGVNAPFSVVTMKGV